MLVEFSVGNYRSFKERQTFSMIAGKKPSHEFKTGFKSPERLLTSAVLLGANASGKSNLIKAMDFFKGFVVKSAVQKTRGDQIKTVPFAFSNNTREQPSEFEAIFVYKKQMYQYGFRVDQKRVWEEWLYVTPQGGEKETARTLFERTFDEEKKSYQWRFPSLAGQKKTWQDATRDNALFLSTAVQLNSEQLKAPFDWIEEYFHILDEPNMFPKRFTARLIVEEQRHKDILSFISNIDRNIIGIEVSEKKWEESNLPDDMPDLIKQEIIKAMSEEKIFDVSLVHKTEDGHSYKIDLSEESDGTQIMFGLAAPLLDILEEGWILAIDELNKSLHPLLLKAIIGLFHNLNVNKNNAQLIFTGHETCILEDMERDQVWLTEKGQYGDTQLIPLLSYKPRKDEDKRKAYLQGRYGGLPDIERLVNG
ncbi:MAG: ATP-binding protein [Alphaproteobacteria bacterium CG_4_9_14_3_um_filter_47_13]|nr:MAG: ATP-binding protein [Alphaproteobacteria bacterium CG_4_9_14_3_um_filter_47_13]